MNNRDPDAITRCPNCLRFMSDDRLLWHMDNECLVSPCRDHVTPAERTQSDVPLTDQRHDRGWRK